MDRGWVKLYRKIQGNDLLWMDNNAFVVFVKLLMTVDRKEGWYRTGQRALAEKFYMPYGTMYKVLKRLEEHGLIIVENKNKYSKIWITNWTVYQSNREIDNILEHNAPLHKKHPEKRKLQMKSKPREAHREAQGKRTGSAREDYNKNKELRRDIVSTNVDTIELENTHKEKISKLYYEAIRALDVPVTNHNTIKGKITELAKDQDHDKIINYLTFMRDQYAELEWDYKPAINSALDIYTKRTQIKNTFQKHVTNQTQPKGRAFTVRSKRS